MSFLGGAECSTAANPLSQFSKTIQDDKSLQRDRLVGRGPGGQFESFRTQQAPVGHNDQLLESFTQQAPSLVDPLQQPFAMDQMRRELGNYQAGQLRSGSLSWVAEFDSNGQTRFPTPLAAQKASGGMSASRFSPADFQRFEQMKRSASPLMADPLSQQSPGFQASGYQRRAFPMSQMSSMGFGGAYGMAPTSYRQMGTPGPMSAQTQEKGKGRVVDMNDENWEQQFAAIDAQAQTDLDAEARAAQADIERELNDIDRSVESETNYDGDFESIWRGVQAEREANRSLMEDEDLGFQQNGNLDLEGNPWEGFDTLNTHSSFRDPQLGNYIFEDKNFFNTGSNPFEQGVKIMQEAGNLSLAALAFEAAVMQNPQHLEAWLQLGSSQAQNEKESPAIRALEQALKLDPNNLEALMGLAVSYTNEGYDSTAYRTLEQWLSIKYPGIVSSDDLSRDAQVGFTDRHELHEKVTQYFIRAAQLSPDGEHMDPDVQVGLGVLFYGAEEYDKAVDCFEAALASTEVGTMNQRQQVHLLWNRLGATLANSGRSEDAITAYEKALTLNPNFVRARYNLGVSCINIGCYEEAAQHLLGALSMHRVMEREGRERVQQVVNGEGGATLDEGQLEMMMNQNQSTNLYDTLRRVFSQMDRRDLSEKVVAGMDVEVFRKDFDF
ncbi:Peroxisomal membrane signal receptor PTS1 [Agyrium rufum]|nr:Peroxisomal membrane signal receptor PTS1 [Agyrium rufum]